MKAIESIYQGLIDDVSTREENLQDTLPIEDTAGLPNHLRSVIEDWETGRKSLRTVPVCKVYAREFGQPIEEETLGALTGLDTIVNVLDDVIDSKGLTTDRRIKLTVNAAFSSVLIAENLPIESQDDVSGLLREYFTALFQIPAVESQLSEQIVASDDKAEEVDAAICAYSYRARDIDAFARLPAIVAELDTGTEQRILHDLRTYRARRLLVKDIHDVSRDLSDNDLTPVIHLLQKYPLAEEFTETIEWIYEDFEYTEEGNQQYGSLLKDLEGRPADIQSLLQDAKDTITQYET